MIREQRRLALVDLKQPACGVHPTPRSSRRLFLRFRRCQRGLGGLLLKIAKASNVLHSLLDRPPRGVDGGGRALIRQER